MTSFEEFSSFPAGSNVIPVVETLAADTETPVSVFLKLRKESPFAFLLESVEGGENLARFSFLGCDPFAAFHIRGNSFSIQSFHKDVSVLPSLVEKNDHPIAALNKIFAHFKSAHIEGLPRFTCGAVGYFGYESARLVERIPESAVNEMDVPDASLMFFDSVVIFDNVKHQLSVVSNGYCPTRTQSELRSEYAKALADIERLKALIAVSPDGRISNRASNGTLQFRTPKETFIHSVEAAKEYIKAGDAFQVVVSQRASCVYEADPFELYRVLRRINPSPYMFFLQMDETHVVGSSPEMLVRIENGLVETRPIAGTRRRGKTPAEDKALATELRMDEKERAEHLMLVDLGRNDLGRISQFGKVEVKDFMSVEKYSHVMHLVSSVQGWLREDLSPLDAFFAVFPAGTLSGAPKIRAMEIIAELEPVKRNVYGGAVGYIDFSGNLDTCIAIRTAVVHKKRLSLQAGAGIVFDSTPEREYEETMEKLGALLQALSEK